jgi:hypothetical protein
MDDRNEIVGIAGMKMTALGRMFGGGKRALRGSAALAGLALALISAGPACADSDVVAGPVAMRRLTQEQYRQIIADVFGPTVRLGGRFEPDVREAGLLAVGASQVSITASGLEQYDSMARAIASQVVDENHRELLIPCQPASATAPDDACAKQFLAKVGRLLYRRPLTDKELTAQVAAANAATVKVKNFYTGLGLSLAGLLEAPQFLFRQEVVEPDPDHAGEYRLDAYSKATRLSFLLWNAAPDPELLAAAESGDINTQAGLTKQVDRLLASPRLEAGVRAFFNDMLGYDAFDTLAKDQTLYPKFTPKMLGDAQEQTLRTIVDQLLVEKGDYRDLFTTRKTFLTPLLASIYRVPAVFPDGFQSTWIAYDYPKDAPEAGILTQASFVALHSQPGRSSATIRGKALREVLLCQKVPNPPGNVKFDIVQNTNDPNFKTARQRVKAHATQATCAGCHKIMDPVGLAFENFDTIGGFRTTENGADIDASGELDGVKFTDVVGLGKAVHDNPATTACVVNRVYEFASGHKPTKTETAWIGGTLQKDFAASGYKFPDLLRDVATSDVFYRAVPPQTGALDQTTKLAGEMNSHLETKP